MQRHYNGILGNRNLDRASAGIQSNPKIEGKATSSIFNQNGTKASNPLRPAAQAITEEANSVLDNLTHIQTQKIDSHTAINPYNTADGAVLDSPLMRGNQWKSKSNAPAMNLA